MTVSDNRLMALNAEASELICSTAAKLWASYLSRDYDLCLPDDFAAYFVHDFVSQAVEVLRESGREELADKLTEFLNDTISEGE